MAAELTPITQFPIAEGLPPYLDAERIQVNTGVLRRATSLGCFGEVEINWHADVPTTTEVIGIGGFAGDNMAFAAAGGKATQKPLGKYDYEQSALNVFRAVAGHTRPKLTISVDLPQIQDSIRIAKDVGEWSRRINHEVTGQVRAASRKHLLGSSISALESTGAIEMLGFALTMQVSLQPYMLDAYTNMGMLETGVFVSGLGLIHSAGKVMTNAYGIYKSPENCPTHPKDTCLSILPGGYHIDRYLGIEALTRARRIIRPMPIK